MKNVVLFSLILIFVPILWGFNNIAKGMEVADTIKTEKPDNLPAATFAGGCFWCLESEFRAIQGVVFTEPGYAGGETNNPSYKDVTTGETGHAEAVNIYFDPAIITYRALADYFLRKAHDPTQVNRQGVDVGTQYRSAIFYHSDQQKADAEAAIKAASDEKVWKNKIVTELVPAAAFWEAEEYHKQYYEKYEAATGKPHIRVQLKHKK